MKHVGYTPRQDFELLEGPKDARWPYCVRYVPGPPLFFSSPHPLTLAQMKMLLAHAAQSRVLLHLTQIVVN